MEVLYGIALIDDTNISMKSWNRKGKKQPQKRTLRYPDD